MDEEFILIIQSTIHFYIKAFIDDLFLKNV